MNPLHSSKSAEWYTPPEILEPARYALGGFDVDPASSPTANERVRAAKIYTIDDDSLEQPWHGRVIVNPPGTCRDESSHGVAYPGCGSALPSGAKRRVCSCDLPRRFWNHLLGELEAGRATSAVWIGFNSAQLQTFQSRGVSPLDFVTCVTKKRIRYLRPSGGQGASPPHGSYVTLLAEDGSPEECRFVEVFRAIGAIGPACVILHCWIAFRNFAA